MKTLRQLTKSGLTEELKSYKNIAWFLPKKQKIFTKKTNLNIDSNSISIILGKNWVIDSFLFIFGGKIDEHY